MSGDPAAPTATGADRLDAAERRLEAARERAGREIARLQAPAADARDRLRKTDKTIRRHTAALLAKLALYQQRWAWPARSFDDRMRRETAAVNRRIAWLEVKAVGLSMRLWFARNWRRLAIGAAVLVLTVLAIRYGPLVVAEAERLWERLVTFWQFRGGAVGEPADSWSVSP